VIQLDQEPAIMVRKRTRPCSCASRQATDVKHRVLSLKAATSTLKGEARTARTKQNSPIIRQLGDFHHVINSDEV